MVTISPLRRTRLADSRCPSQDEVARAVGITQSFYALLEQGDRAASTKVAESLADYFRVEVTDIFTASRYSSEPIPAEV